MMQYVLVLVALVFSMASNARVKYEPGANKCPRPDSKNRYLDVPLFHDLKAIANIENIPGLNTHENFVKDYRGFELNIYFELINEFDENKELVILIPGGPGQSHDFVHAFVRAFKNKSDFFSKYNVIAMDHRGLGCSRPTFPGDEPSESLKMRYAASDIEAIRQHLTPNKKINVWGYSYGSMLAQTYALLYTDKVERLFLGGAFSSHKDFGQAILDFEDLVKRSSPNIAEDYDELVQFYPEYKDRFLDFSTNMIYEYKERLVDMPEKLKKLLSLLRTGNRIEADALFVEDHYVMPWMMRSISCMEIFPYEADPSIFSMFQHMFRYCREFKSMVDYFDYTSSLSKLDMPVFIWGGEFDHVTPAKAMRVMSKKIPNNFLYIDEHIGHGFSTKIDCFIGFMDSFFAKENNHSLELIAKSSACIDKPILVLEDSE